MKVASIPDDDYLINQIYTFADQIFSSPSQSFDLTFSSDSHPRPCSPKKPQGKYSFAAKKYDSTRISLYCPRPKERRIPYYLRSPAPKVKVVSNSLYSHIEAKYLQPRNSHFARERSRVIQQEASVQVDTVRNEQDWEQFLERQKKWEMKRKEKRMVRMEEIRKIQESNRVKKSKIYVTTLDQKIRKKQREAREIKNKLQQLVLNIHQHSKQSRNPVQSLNKSLRKRREDVKRMKLLLQSYEKNISKEKKILQDTMKILIPGTGKNTNKISIEQTDEIDTIKDDSIRQENLISEREGKKQYLEFQRQIKEGKITVRKYKQRRKEQQENKKITKVSKQLSKDIPLKDSRELYFLIK